MTQAQLVYEIGEVYKTDTNGNAMVRCGDGSAAVITGTRIEGFPDGANIKHYVEREGKKVGFSKLYWRVNTPMEHVDLEDNLDAVHVCGAVVFYDSEQVYLIPGEGLKGGKLMPEICSIKEMDMAQFLGEHEKLYGEDSTLSRNAIERKVRLCTKYLAMTGTKRQTLDLDTEASKLTEWERIKRIRETRRVLEQML